MQYQTSFKSIAGLLCLLSFLLVACQSKPPILTTGLYSNNTQLAYYASKHKLSGVYYDNNTPYYFVGTVRESRINIVLWRPLKRDEGKRFGMLTYLNDTTLALEIERFNNQSIIHDTIYLKEQQDWIQIREITVDTMIAYSDLESIVSKKISTNEYKFLPIHETKNRWVRSDSLWYQAHNFYGFPL